MIRVLSAVAAGVLVATIGGAATQSSTGEITGTLVFSAHPDARGASGSQLLVGNLASGSVRRFYRVDGTGEPSWSPDGTEVVLWLDSTATGNHIWRVDANGRRPRRITSLRERSERPDWSSTGRIAFVRWHRSRGCCKIETEIYTVAPNGRNLRRVTVARGEDTDPAWSPDGSRIAFSSDRSGNFELYVMNADGSGLRRLTHSGSYDYGPAWSPDGTRIAFWRDADAGSLISVMNVDGTGQQTLSGRSAETAFPAWSPDGQFIAYVRLGEIWVMNADGREKRKLIDGPYTDAAELDWKP